MASKSPRLARYCSIGVPGFGGIGACLPFGRSEIARRASRLSGITRLPRAADAATPNQINRPPLRSAAEERHNWRHPPMGSKTASTPSPVSARTRSTKSSSR
jgi:hypothetical protein